MTTIHHLHTTIQFPGLPGDGVLPPPSTFSFLWPDLASLSAPWSQVSAAHPLLHPLIEYALAACAEEEPVRAHYQRACTSHQAGNHVLAARWLNLSIECTMALVSRWLTIATMLADCAGDAPELARLIQPLLMEVGLQQQRLFTLLAILQGLFFSSCQSQQAPPILISMPDEAMQEQDADARQEVES